MRHAALLLVAVACGEKSAPPAPARTGPGYTGPFTPAPAEGAEVVAEVNGERIYRADVERHARPGDDPRAVLGELIDLELCAQEAHRRGLAADPDAVLAAKRESVRRLLETRFEPSFDGPEDVPQDEVDQLWNDPAIQGYFNHPRYHDVTYVRVKLDRKTATREAEAAARAQAEAIYARAVAARPHSGEEFVALAEEVAPVEHQSYKTARYHSTVEEFAAAAFSIDEIGEVARPARTEWGYDVLYLAGIIPERKTSKAEAEPEIRQKRFEVARRQGFVRWADALAHKTRVQRDPAWQAWLERIEVIAPQIEEAP